MWNDDREEKRVKRQIARTWIEGDSNMVMY